MEASPHDFKPDNFKNKLNQIQGVVYIRKLHVWSLSRGKVFMTCHIGYSGEDFKVLLKKVKKLAKKYGIKHSTIEIQPCKPLGWGDELLISL